VENECISLLRKLVETLESRQTHIIGSEISNVEYDAETLQGYHKLKDQALELYGQLLKRILNGREISREAAESAIEEVLGNMGIVKLFSGGFKALLYNDLRRMGVLAIGHSGGWKAGERAMLTSLGMWLSRCIDKVDAETLGALAIASCYLKDWGLDPQEAGFCYGIYRGLPDKYAPIVKRAVVVFYNKTPPECIPYGSDIIKARALLTSPLESQSGLTTA